MKLKLLLLFVTITVSIAVNAQLNNLNFENGDFKNWRLYRDPANIALPINNGVYNYTDSLLFRGTTYYTATAATPYHSITAGTTLDKFGKFPIVCNLPGGGFHSAKLGDDAHMSTAQGVAYNFKIPDSANRYNLVFYYATVLEDPGSHDCWQMPFFKVSIYDSANPKNRFTDLDFSITRCNSLYKPNLLVSNTLFNGDSINYTAWKPANMLIKNMAGRVVTVRVSVGGCSLPSPGAHFGYGYIDFNSNPVEQYNMDTIRICENDNCFSFTPPAGYKGYKVYDSATNNILAVDTIHATNVVTKFNLCGNNKPAINSVMKVALTPYSWYGFVDTLTYYIKSNACLYGSPSLSIDKIDTTSCTVAVDVPVRGKNLKNISKLQGSLYWDTAYMNYGGVKFATSNINMNFNHIDVTNAANGNLTYNWSDTANHNIADTDPLFTLVLYPKPDVSGGSSVWFDNTPAAFEIDTAIGIAAVNSTYCNGWIILSDTPQIIQNVNIITCSAGCIPVHYQWYYNGVPIQFDTLNYIYPTGSGVYTCIVTYKDGKTVGSNTLNVVLPVVLRSFKVLGYKSYNTISWQTVSEINTIHFNIQRSTNGKDFSAIGKVAAKGAGDYTYKDISTDNLRLSKLYYRLEIVDKDGSKSYSEIRELSMDNGQLIISPNPAKDKVTITGTNIKQVRLLDNTGKIVVVKEVSNKEAINMSITQLPKGLYMVQATYNDGSTKAEKLVVE